MKNSRSNRHLSGFAAQSKGKTGLRRIVRAAAYSKDGLAAAFAREAAFRQVLLINAVLAAALPFMSFAVAVKMMLLLAGALSVVVELFNTGLEAAIDHTSTDRHPLAKIGKDAGSAAQLVMLATIAVLWLTAIFA